MTHTVQFSRREVDEHPAASSPLTQSLKLFCLVGHVEASVQH